MLVEATHAARAAHAAAVALLVEATHADHAAHVGTAALLVEATHAENAAHAAAVLEFHATFDTRQIRQAKNGRWHKKNKFDRQKMEYGTIFFQFDRGVGVESGVELQ